MKRSVRATTARQEPGKFDWLDREPTLRKWFTDWLLSSWRRIWGDSLRQLHTKADFERYDRCDAAINRLRRRLIHLKPSQQVFLLTTTAAKWGFHASGDEVADELRLFLTTAGEQSKHAEALIASPWCNYFATANRMHSELVGDLPRRFYPGDPDLQLALENIIYEFASVEIWRAPAPAASAALATKQLLSDLKEAVRALPSNSRIDSILGDAQPALHQLAIALDDEISEMMKRPETIVPPSGVRRAQRALFGAVHRLGKAEQGPDKLAEFVVNVLKGWPKVPGGMEFDPHLHFSREKAHEIINTHLGTKVKLTSREARPWWWIFQMIVCRDELRAPLLRLACHADQQSSQRRKGWQHLLKAMRVVFKHITRPIKDAERFRNFERANFPFMRALTRQQRMRLLPELGNDPDHSIRDLTKSERMTLFQCHNRKTRKVLSRDPDGRGAFDAGYGRAMKTVRRELDQT